jgi:DNA repair protein RadA/Sms
VQRLKEADKLGFRQAVLPKGSNDVAKNGNARLTETASLPDLVARIAATGPDKRQRDD